MGFQNINAFLKTTKRFSEELVPRAAQRVTAALFIAGAGMVIDRSPVNLGRLRGNWQSSDGSIKTNLIESVDKSGSQARERAVAVAVAARPFSVLYLSNNVPQILVVERGGYRPADPATDPDSLARRRASRSPIDRKRAALIAGGEGAPLVKGGFPIQSPRGMVAVSVVELRAKAEQIIKAANPRVRRRSS